MTSRARQCRVPCPPSTPRHTRPYSWDNLLSRVEYGQELSVSKVDGNASQISGKKSVRTAQSNRSVACCFGNSLQSPSENEIIITEAAWPPSVMRCAKKTRQTGGKCDAVNRRQVYHLCRAGTGGNGCNHVRTRSARQNIPNIAMVAVERRPPG